MLNMLIILSTNAGVILSMYFEKIFEATYMDSSAFSAFCSSSSCWSSMFIIFLSSAIDSSFAHYARIRSAWKSENGE